MPCRLCEKRKPKRHCPAVAGEICTVCCGEKREVSLSCPLDCPYLVESREREFAGRLDPSTFPYKEITVESRDLQQNSTLLIVAGAALFEAANAEPGAYDSDVQAALDSLIRTQKTMDSGIYYESQPGTAPARHLAAALRQAIEEFRKNETERAGFTRTRDKDVLTILVFLYRMALDRDNLKPRGRAFVSFLAGHFQAVGAGAERAASPLILPGV